MTAALQAFLVLLALACTLSAHAANPDKTVQWLRAANYPDLPAKVAAVLQSRHCTIPQPNQSGPPRNVIKGDFFHRGQKGWAVLCSRQGKSSILVFRNSYDRCPDVIAESPDNRFIIDAWPSGKVYSREITAVNQRFVLRHYRAYGGLKPPEIDHEGIDDAFLEKASITWYWYNGKWLQLQGAD